jgi:hypothetical protein
MIVTSLYDTYNMEIKSRKFSINIHISQIGAAVAYLNSEKNTRRSRVQISSLTIFIMIYKINLLIIN